jgi:hypothetical protein
MARMLLPVHSSPRLLRIVAAALISLVFAYVDVAAAANCDVQPLVVPLRQRNGSVLFGVDLQLGDQEFQLPISIVENATVVPAVEVCSNLYLSYGFRTQGACVARFGIGLEVDDESVIETREEKMTARLPGRDIEVKDYSVIVLRQKSPQYNASGIGLVSFSLFWSSQTLIASGLGLDIYRRALR